MSFHSMCLADEPDLRSFDDAQVESLQQDERFDFYDKSSVDSSYWEGFQEWIANILESISKFLFDHFNITVSPIVFDILFYGFIAVMMMFLILKLMGADFRKIVYYRRKKKSEVGYSVDEEEIENMDFESLIAEAKSKGNYTLIIRYYYLYALQLLDEAGKVEYHNKKTNSEYLHELDNEDLSRAFSRLAYTFEYVWYGHFEATSPHGLQMEQNFNELKSTLA